MDPARFAAPEWGKAVRTLGTASYAAFIPAPLSRELTLDTVTIMKLSEADAALGRLAGSGRLLPNPHLLGRRRVQAGMRRPTGLAAVHGRLTALGG